MVVPLAAEYTSVSLFNVAPWRVFVDTAEYDVAVRAGSEKL